MFIDVVEWCHIVRFNWKQNNNAMDINTKENDQIFPQADISYSYLPKFLVLLYVTYLQKDRLSLPVNGIWLEIHI